MAMIVVLADHRQTIPSNMETEMNLKWTGAGKGPNPHYGHAAPISSRVGGVTVTIHPILGRYVTDPLKTKLKKSYGDNRGWGRWASVYLCSQNKTLIIGTYGPTGSGKPDQDDPKGSMWEYQQRGMEHIPEDQREDNPAFQFIRDLVECINEAQADGLQVMLMGDVNINIRNDTKKTREWTTKLREAEMYNPMTLLWPSTPHIHTFPRDESWLDQHWISRSIYTNGTILEAGIDKSRVDYKSDHYMIGARMNYTALLGKVAPTAQGTTTRPRTLKSANPQLKKMYMDIASGKWESKLRHTLGARAEALRNLAENTKRGGTKIQRKRLQKRMNKFMAHLTKAMLSFENAMVQKNNSKLGSHSKNLWSAVFC
jgi:hypothetical protein